MLILIRPKRASPLAGETDTETTTLACSNKPREVVEKAKITIMLILVKIRKEDRETPVSPPGVRIQTELIVGPKLIAVRQNGCIEEDYFVCTKVKDISVTFLTDTGSNVTILSKGLLAWFRRSQSINQ